MEIKDVLGTGALVVGLAAGMTVAQNQLQISGSRRTDLAPVQQGTVTDAAGTGIGVSGGGTRAGFVDTDPLRLNRIVDGSYASGFLLHNPHCAEEIVSLVPHLLDRDDGPLAVAASFERVPVAGETKAKWIASGERWTMAPGAYDRVRVKFAAMPASSSTKSVVPSTVWAALRSSPMDYGGWTGRLPAKGALILTLHTPTTDPEGKEACKTSRAVPGSGNLKRPLTLQPPLPSSLDTGVVLASFGLALIATLLSSTIILGSKDLFLRGRMGDVTFDFKNSLGANVAIGAGILAALTSGTVLSQDQYSSNSATYLVLASLFTALVPLGAALYGLIRPQVAVATAGTQSQGYVSVYLISSAIVLWGAFGQLLLLGMILRELTLARVMSLEPAGLLIFMTKGLIALLIVYAVTNALATIRQTSEKASTPAGMTERPPAAMM